MGKPLFWLFFIGLTLTFSRMHMLGLLGMPRRQYTYPPGLGWDGLNLLASIGVLFLIAGVLAFLFNFVTTIMKPANEVSDPWDAFTLEWATTSPPPVENFVTIPLVRSRRPLWDAKYPEKADWRSAGH